MKKLLFIFILTSLSLFAFGQGDAGDIFLQDTLRLKQVTIKGERSDPGHKEEISFCQD